MIHQYYIESRRDERYPEMYALGDMYSGMNFVFIHMYEILYTDMKRGCDDIVHSSFNIDLRGASGLIGWEIDDLVMVSDMRQVLNQCDTLLSFKFGS